MKKAIITAVITNILAVITCFLLFGCSKEPTQMYKCTTYTVQLVDNGQCLVKDTISIEEFSSDINLNNTGDFDRTTGVITQTVCK